MALEGDKRILVIAFLVSLTVSLVVNLIYVYGGQLCGGGKENIPIVIQETRGPAGTPGTPTRRRGGEGGGMGGFGMRQSATPELLALYKERAALYEKYANTVIEAEKAAGKDSMDVLKASFARDKAKLTYWRREADMRQMTGAAEAFLQYKFAGKVLKYTDVMYKAGVIQSDKLNLASSDLIDARIQLEEALLRIRDKAAWEKATKPLENYPINVTDELLRGLLALEQPRAPR
ncbi:MAG: hypothetical protein BWY31_02806 [Lentisphaerae bacterium ADurb.Bin242]|nr:MAG: hypothetical protein BWY31_02806 [Lentisphaerae bacterium ADurb.Bin242]